MNVAFFTLFERDYDLGVAALLHSLLVTGFQGEAHVFYRVKPPRWALKRELEDSYTVMLPGVSIIFRQIDSLRHLGYEKPFVALRLLQENPRLDAVVYADPDVIILCPWSFIQDWVESGIALCVDSNIAFVSTAHPWRRSWSHLLKRTGREALLVYPTSYHNSGFFGVHRAHQELLKTWCELTTAYEESGGDTKRFIMQERFRAIVGDQDLLAAALMASDAPIATLGQEGMGFNGFNFLLSHCIEPTKPWAQCFTLSALGGCAPSPAAKLWLAHSRGPLRSISTFKYLLTKTDLFIATAISRIWRR